MTARLPALATALAASALLITPPAEAGPGCDGLDGIDIPASAMSLPTGGGHVTAVTRTPTLCQVDADLLPVDPAAPPIKMRLALPQAWNGKAMMFGGGGYDGTIPDLTAQVPFGPADRPTPLARGYAVFASDSGHQAGPVGVPSLDGSFGVNDEALRNFAAGDATKKTRDASLFLLRRAGAEPGEIYFAGGSTGGREALNVAQRWPTAFDGVIAAYPAWNNLSEILDLGHLTRILARPNAFPGPEKQALLHESVMNACDGLDGITDRVISNPDGCRFDPHALRCPRGADTGPHCLSDPQIASVMAMSAPFRWPYPIASGETGYPGFPFLSGADMRTPLLGFGTTPPANPMPDTSGYGMRFWDQWVKHFLTRDPGHDPLAVDPSAPGEWRQRISELSAIQDRNDADLGPFQRAGGKLILLHGAADELVSHWSTTDYQQRVRDILGDRATGEFLRYYVVPGANHANAGTPAFAAGWDSLTALETWTDTGRPPRNPVVTDLNHPRTRPLCEHPAWPRYVGGNPDDAASFRCQQPAA